MNSYYSLTEKIKDYLISHSQINTVVIGNISDVDLAKQTLYPLAQIIVDRGSFIGSTLQFNVIVMVLDSVVQSNEDPLLSNDITKGMDNKQDVFNSTLAVLNGLQHNLKQGRLFSTNYQLGGNASIVPMESVYGNLLSGWRMDVSVLLPNTEVSNCAEYGIGDAVLDTRIYTMDSTVITMDNDNI